MESQNSFSHREINNATRNNIDPQTQLHRTKIFVGGLAHGTEEHEFKTYFENFGTVIDSVIIRDTKTQRARGFGFVTFDSEEAVTNVLNNRFHELKNKLVEIKRAKPKEIVVQGNNYGPSQQDLSYRNHGFPQVQYNFDLIHNGSFNPTGFYGANGSYAHGYDASCYYPFYGARYGFGYDPNYPGGLLYCLYY